MIMQDDMPVTVDIVSANQRHDQEHGNPYDYQTHRVRCAWNEGALSRRGKLTDRKITKYERDGFYSTEFKLARKELMDKKAAKRAARDGHFVKVDGRLIYSL